MSVYGDPSVGPYDGIEDTLIGVENNSAAYVPAIVVTGPGSNLAGLDGDGLCAYPVTGYSGCPFGPTGYEGPDTAIVTDATLPDSAEIDFTSGGLAPHGGTTFFSLEGLLTGANLLARQGHLGGYVALGDSYSAGEGTGDYSYGTGTLNHCDRSPHAYGPLLSTDRNLGTIGFFACSGAVTADIVAPNAKLNVDVNTGLPEGPQIDRLSDQTKVVTLTIGGNDVGFSEVVKACLFARFAVRQVWGHPGCSNDKALQATVQRRLNALAGGTTTTTPLGTDIHSILSVLLLIHQKAPSAKIYIATYPRFFGPFKGECGIGSVIAKNVPGLGFASAAVKITGTDAQWLNDQADKLDTTIATAAKQAPVISGASVTLVDAAAAFDHHRLCDNLTSWLGPVTGTADAKAGTASIDSASFHPTTEGQKLGYEAAFLASDIGR